MTHSTVVRYRTCTMRVSCSKIMEVHNRFCKHIDSTEFKIFEKDNAVRDHCKGQRKISKHEKKLLEQLQLFSEMIFVYRQTR